MTPTTAEQLTIERHAHDVTRGRMLLFLGAWSRQLRTAQTALDRGAPAVTQERLQQVLDDMAFAISRLEE